MTNTIKRWIASDLRAGVAITAKAPGGRYLLEQVLNRAMNRSESIRHQGNEEFEKQATESVRYLSEAGLVLHAKRHAEMFDDPALRYVYNQIWRRPTQPDPCQ